MNVEWPIMPHGFARFQDQAQVSLLQSFDSMYQGFVCPLAGPEYADLSPFITIALAQSESRDALNAFTSYMIFARSTDKCQEQKSLELYQSAVFSLKEKVKQPLQKVEMVSVLMAATFLGLLEGLGIGNAYHVIAHLSLVARIGQQCFQDSIWKGCFLPVKRILLEDIIYNLACLSIFCPIPDSAMNALDWASYKEAFSGSGSDIPNYQLSPHFGGNYEFYQLILEVTHVSRQKQKLNRASRTYYADTWLRRLEYLDDRLQKYYESAPEMVAEMYVAKYQLYAIALRIFSLKFRHLDLLPSSSVVLQQMHKARQILARHVLQVTYPPALTWPLVVLLCSCADFSTFEFFSARIEDIRSKFGRGYLHHLVAVQEKIGHSLEPKSNSSVIEVPDNLGLLLLEKGLLSDST